MSWCSDAPEDEAISLFAGLLANPDVPLRLNNEKDMCSNKGFRVINNEMVTYIQHKKGLSYYYDKRIVLADGVSTVPLDI